MSKDRRFLKRAIIWILAVAAVIVAIVFIVKAFNKKPVEVTFPTVEIQTVHPADVSIYGEYVGRIRAKQYFEVRARVEGYIESMLFTEGTHVAKGQTLFIIDPTLYRANVAQARASLNKAQAAQRKAARDLERIRPLYELNAASKLDLDNAEAAYDAANADVKMAEAELTRAELILSYTAVKSQISGFISESNVDIGVHVEPGAKMPLAIVVNSDTVKVDFSMTALDYLTSKARNVNFGQDNGNRSWSPYVTVTQADGTAYPYRGLVDFADPKVDPKTGTFSVRADMPNPQHTLLPGEFTRVKLLMDVREEALSVPVRALEIEKGASYIYVVRPDSVVERRYIETGPEFDNMVIVERGLTAGENIVVEGYHKLKHGMKVAPVFAPGDIDDPNVDYSATYVEAE